MKSEFGPVSLQVHRSPQLGEPISVTIDAGTARIELAWTPAEAVHASLYLLEAVRSSIAPTAQLNGAGGGPALPEELIDMARSLLGDVAGFLAEEQRRKAN